MPTPLLEVRDLRTEFHTPGGTVQAVRDVSFTISRGETLGVVGESGSGKSVTALSILRLIPEPPGRIVSGSVLLDGVDLLQMSAKDLRAVRGKRISMVFQDPFSSLNPTMNVGDQIMEAIQSHEAVSRADARRRTLELLQEVRIPSPDLRMKQYPHQMSGGQRQRIMIAMAFSTHPDLLIADEPTTALDVSVQAQILGLMKEFQQKSGSSVMLITHDLGVIAETCDRVLVMYAGRIVEEASVTDLFEGPKHPYTMGLLRSLPRLGGARGQRLATIAGQPPDLAHLGVGCAFADRCESIMDICRTNDPAERTWEDGSRVRCHLHDVAP